MLQNKSTFAIIQGFTEYGFTNNNAIQNLDSAKRLGLRTDVYLNICRGKDANTQITTFAKDVPQSLYNTIWVAIEKNLSPGCNWETYTAQSNCQYVQQLIAAAVNTGKKVGIYSSLIDWISIFRDKGACYQFGNYPLWYLSNDGVKSFSGFQPFGGWTTPSLKTYASRASTCGTYVNLNY
jgi:GH25 family lysozyme M1 (1,4-beta-N-acetylmuramidase)